MPTLRTRNNAQSSSGIGLQQVSHRPPNTGRRKSAGSTTVQGRRLTRSAIALQPRVTEQPEFDSSTPLPSNGRHPSFPSPSPPPPSLPPSPLSPDPTVTVRNALAISYPNLAKKSTGLRATRRQFVQRSQYTMAEDLAMLNYLLEHNLIDKVNLRSTWRELKRQHVTSHSAESMRVRVLRCLVHQLSSLLPDAEAEKIEFLRSCLLIPSQRDHNQLHPTGQPITLVAPSRSTRLRNSRSPAAAEVASADASPRTPPRSPAVAAATDAVSSLSQSRVSDSIVEENAFESGGPSPHQCSTPSKAPPKQSPPLFTRALTEPSVEDHRNLRLSEPPPQVTRLTADSSQEPACLLPNFCEEPEVTAASSPPSLSAIVSSTAFAVRAVDDICRRYPFLESLDVLQLLFMTGGSLSAVESLLRGLTPHSSSSSVSQSNGADGGGGGLSNGEATAAAADQPPALWLPEDDCSLRSTDKAKVAEVVDKFGLQAVLSRLSYLTGRGLCEGAGS